jgi:hypothetical protein
MSDLELSEQCLSSFQEETGYNFLELLMDKQKYEQFVDEDRKKDLTEYTKQAEYNLKCSEAICLDTIVPNMAQDK